MNKVFSVLTCLVLVSHGFSQEKNVESILKSVFQTNTNIKALQMDLLINERIRGEMSPAKNFVKVNYEPFQLYIKQTYPHAGMEMLYNELINKNKVLIYTNSFPWKTIGIDPLGLLARKETHHSIYKMGYRYVINLLENELNKYPGSEICKYLGIVKYDNNLCYKLEISIPDFKFYDYTVKPGETLESLSYKLMVNDYMIMERNPSVSNIQDIKAGDILKVPSSYAKSFTIYIDVNTNLLVGIKVYDDIDLWEEFVYRNVKVNPGFSFIDFSTKNMDYKIR